MNKIKEKGIPDLLLKAFSFFIILFILDFSIGSILRYLYFKQTSGLLYRTTYSIDSTRAEFLIFGSSTANHHYDTRLFEKRLGNSVYNTGRDGSMFFYNYAIFKSVLKRFHPKTAILDFNTEELKFSEESYDRISALLPYYKNHPEIRSVVELESPYEKYKLLSKIYPFNSLLFTIAIGNTNFNKKRELVDDENGYIPLTHVWNRKIATQTSLNYELDSNKINVLKSLIKECKDSNVQLYICISPRFVKYTGKDISVDTTREIAKEFNIPFYDFSSDTLFWDHKEYFADESHLNETGAEIFSNAVIDNILQHKNQITANAHQNSSLETN